MKKSTTNWFETISTPGLFKHFNRYSHLFSRHMSDISDSDLKARLRKIQSGPDELIIYSRFHASEDEVIGLVLECIGENLEVIDRFADDNAKADVTICKDYEISIGEGYVKNTSWDQKFQMNRLEVVITKTESVRNPFAVKTAYPAFTTDQSDDGWDAIDAWIASRIRP